MMKVDGKCHCGKISFQAEVDPKDVSICHCTDCQVLTGSPYRVSVVTQAPMFMLLNGDPKIYIKTADDGTPRAQGFCADCGTPIFAAEVTNPSIYYLRLGCLKQRAELSPQRQIWCRIGDALVGEHREDSCNSDGALRSSIRILFC